MGEVHKILHRSETPDGIEIQIEDWRNVYPDVYKTLIIGCYPIAKQSGGYFIKKGERIRCSIEKFDTDEEVLDAFERLENGSITIEDLDEHIVDNKHRYYLCLTDEYPVI